MDERDNLKIRIIAALHALGVLNEERALSLWAIAIKIDDGKAISVRFVARVLEVLCVEGYVDTAQHRDDPSVYWLARESALSDLRAHLGAMRDFVGEAHQTAETQLPALDFCVDAESDDPEK